MLPPLPSPEDIQQGVAAGRRIAQLWGQIAGYLRQNKSRVLFTGMQGVGKTVLFDYLTGKGYAPGYRPPTGHSAGLESGQLRTGDRIGLLVVPGQGSKPRYDAADDTILGKAPPDGIVHILANGFASLRGTEPPDVLQKMAKVKTITEHQKIQRDREFDELREVCGWVRQGHRKARKPSWGILVVTKYDLFSDKLPVVRDEYFPGGRGRVVKLLDELTSQVGSDNFRWQSATACSWLEPFAWKTETISSQFTTAQRDTLVEELAKLILGLCQEGSNK